MKELKEKKFHSRELVPSSYGISEETVNNFNEHIRKGYHFAEGEEVVHVHNLEQKMNIGELIKKEGKSGQKKLLLDGVKCHWWVQI